MGLENNVTYNVRFRWSRSLTLMTVGIWILVLAAITITIIVDHSAGVWISCLMPLLLLVPAFMSPARLIIDDKGITIKKIYGKVFIPIGAIVEVRTISKEERSKSIRIFGSGGLYGYFGDFWNEKIGDYKLYATEKRDMIYVKTIGEAYVISSRDSGKAMEVLEHYMCAVKA